MLYEFALLPDVIEEAITKPDEGGQRELLNLLSHIRENGSLVDLGNGDWSSYVFSLLSQSQTGYLCDIREMLEHLHDHGRVIPHGVGSKRADVNWLDEANSARGNCRYEWIVLSHDVYGRLSDPPDYYLPFPVPPSPKTAWQHWEGKRSHTLRKCESEFRIALSPLFRHASRVHLVDPYFNCHRTAYKDFLALCIDLIQASSAQHPQLFIHAGDPQRDDQRHCREDAVTRANAWRSYLQSVNPSRPITFRVFLWGDRLPERMHNRYIFTDQSFGIKTGHGLDCHDPSKASSDDWDLKDIDEANATLAKYTSRPIYKKLDSVVVVR